MRILFLFLGVTFFISCNEHKNHASHEVKKDSAEIIVSPAEPVKLSYAEIDEIIDTLYKLDIVKNASERINSVSMGSRNISFMPDSIPFSNNELYIAAGDNRSDRFETFINFYYNIKSKNIRVYDVVNDDTVDVKIYEERQK